MTHFVLLTEAKHCWFLQ